MHIYSVNDGTKVHICDFQNVIIIKADIENKQEIREVINLFCCQISQILVDPICLGEQKQMLILLINFLCMPIRFVVPMLVAAYIGSLAASAYRKDK